MTMAGNFSDYLEGKLLDHILRNVPYTSPGAQIWIALYTSDPTDADTGTEVSGGSYARVQCTAWDVVSGGHTQNTNDITFATATANWGTISHVGIRDNSAGGNLLFHGPLAQSKVVNTNDTFKFLAGDLDVTLD
jgi:hypothetical protein